jgi:GDP dissociation inhibitor
MSPTYSSMSIMPRTRGSLPWMQDPPPLRFPTETRWGPHCRCFSFCCHSYVQAYEADNPKTHEGLDLAKMTMAELYAHFGLVEMTIDFIGHALALHQVRVDGCPDGQIDSVG